MNPFTYTRANEASDALLLGNAAGAKYLGGGTNLVDLMRETLETPTALIDITNLSNFIEETTEGGLRIGAGARNSAVAEHPIVRTRCPVLARALLAGASGQIRNMATVGGNILQRTRCTYFYDDDGSRCNKRQPGQGCDAIEGLNRNHAILGASPHCVAAHPSDMCVALAALDATVHLRSAGGERTLPFDAVHRLPGDTPHLETALEPGELTPQLNCLHSASRPIPLIARFAIVPATLSHLSPSRRLWMCKRASFVTFVLRSAVLR